jgi:hypothetical protein
MMYETTPYMPKFTRIYSQEGEHNQSTAYN